VPGIPQFKEKNKENETFQKQSAILEELVKLPLAFMWHPPYTLPTPAKLVRATSERFLLAMGTFRATLASDSH
jgi:hypothetical protein